MTNALRPTQATEGTERAGGSAVLSVGEVVAMVRAYRADIIAQSTLMTDGAAGTGRVPHLVPVNEPPAATAESGKDA